VDCPVTDCRQWINYADDLNCTLIAVDKHGKMTLREVSERLGVSFVRIKQIQDKALLKASKNKDIASFFES
jgi:DNA-directed RNA polymerase sigma subunit (sigma70/sigma32)